MKHWLIIGLIFLCLPTWVVADAQTPDYRNLYVLVEPSVLDDNEDEGKIFLQSEAIFLGELIDWIGKGRRKFANIVIYIAGRKEPIKRITRKEPKKLKAKSIARSVFKASRAIRRYSIAKELANFTKTLDKEQWKGSETLFVIFGDINFVGKDDTDSHGSYLNAGLLSNPHSPFVRFFLNSDNEKLNGSGVVVFTRTQLDMAYEKRRRDFILNLFSRAVPGIATYYVGPLRNSMIKRGLSFGLDVIKKARRHELDPLPVPTMPTTRIMQIVNEKGEMVITEENIE